MTSVPEFFAHFPASAVSSAELSGVLVFMVFRGAKAAGRITGWPGIDRFVIAIDQQRVKGHQPH